jgi:hypothetical protein
MLAFLVHSASASAVGYRLIDKENLKVSVWYPSEATEQKVQYGPFDASFAVDAAPRKGKYQPVLVSHGNSGRARNHYLTARALVEAGFIAIAPLHTPDHLIDTDDTATALNWRTRELQIALELVMRDSELGSILDISQVHGLGYSLGALTIMQAAGATIDLTAVDDHCSRNADPAFCDSAGWILRTRLRLLRGVDVHRAMRNTPNVFNTFPYLNGKVALVAPVGQGAVFNSDFFLAKKVFIVGLKDDIVTVPEFHSLYLESIIPDDLLYESLLVPGHHSAFIAPFSKRVTSKEDIPAAKDPVGFNRIDFLDDINTRLQNFYKCCNE